MWHVTNHARLVPTTHFNVLHVLIISSVQAEDVSQHALPDSISMLFQELADHAPPLVLLAALNSSVPPVQMIRLFQLEDSACHAFTHVLIARLI